MTRPHVCAVCRAPATWAIEEIVRHDLLRRDGTIHRRDRPVRTYYCDAHVPD